MALPAPGEGLNHRAAHKATVAVLDQSLWPSTRRDRKDMAEQRSPFMVDLQESTAMSTLKVGHIPSPAASVERCMGMVLASC